MSKIRYRSDEQALNAEIPSQWTSIRTNWGETAASGPPEVIDFSESNDANVAVNLDVSDCTQLIVYSHGRWAYTFTDVATPIGYDSTWIDAGGRYAIYYKQNGSSYEFESKYRAQQGWSYNSVINVPPDKKFFNYRPGYKSGGDKFIIVVKT